MATDPKEQSLADSLAAFEGDADRRDAAATQHRHAVEAGVGATSGGLVGAFVGSAVGGKRGGLLGAIAGALAGGIAGETLGDDLIALEQQAAEVLGEAADENELPTHYNWEQLQALSKPLSKRQ